MSSNEDARFGREGEASFEDIKKTTLFNGKGLYCGQFNKKSLHFDGKAGALIIAGPRSGKLRDVLARNLIAPNAHRRAFILDPKGEQAEISQIALTMNNIEGIYLNMWGLANLPKHSLNALDILVPYSETLFSDIKLVCSSIITLSENSGGSGVQYFEEKAKECLEAIMLAYIMDKGGISFPELYELVNNLLSNENVFKRLIMTMRGSEHSNVRRLGSEMLFKYKKNPRSFDALFGEITKSLNWLSDPLVREGLQPSQYSLKNLTEKDCYFYSMIPAEFLDNVAPLNRCLFTVTTLYKKRNLKAPGILFLADEAAQLKHFPELLEAYNYGPGKGIKVLAVYQGLSQIEDYFGKHGTNSMLAAAQLKMVFGVREIDSANVFSMMTGTETLKYAPKLEQDAARREKTRLVRQALMGDANPFEAGVQVGHAKMASEHRKEEQRAVIMPAEIMNMPENEMLLFISGIGCPLVRAKRVAYWDQKDLAGRFLPNSDHPPIDKVDVTTLWGKRTKKVIREPVPRKYKHLGHYSHRIFRYVDGYRP